MLGGYQIFRLRGVPVRVHWSLVALAALLLMLSVAGGGSPGDVALRLLAPLMLFLTVIAHEAGHSLMATRMGVRVVDVVLTPLGGAARLAGRLDDGRKEAIVAAAGPAVNLVFAGLAFALVEAAGLREQLYFREIFLLENPEEGFYARHPLIAFLGFNLLLGVMNLIPAFPLDGGRVLRGASSTIWGRRAATRFSCRVGFWIAIIFILLPFFLDGSHWWLLPFIGLFIMYSGFKERVVVEAQEFVRSGGFDIKTGSANFAESDFSEPNDSEPNPEARGSVDIIDVEGQVIDYRDAAPDSKPRLNPADESED